jgi:hypothetical protein
MWNTARKTDGEYPILDTYYRRKEDKNPKNLRFQSIQKEQFPFENTSSARPPIDKFSEVCVWILCNFYQDIFQTPRFICYFSTKYFTRKI